MPVGVGTAAFAPPAVAPRPTQQRYAPPRPHAAAAAPDPSCRVPAAAAPPPTAAFGGAGAPPPPQLQAASGAQRGRAPRAAPLGPAPVLPADALTDDGLGREVHGTLCKREEYMDTDDCARTHPNRTWYFRKERDLEKLVSRCSSVLDCEPSHPTALLIRASCLSKLNKLTAAIADYTTYLHGSEGRPRDAAGCDMGDLDAAIRDYTGLLEADPSHANAGYARGACHNLKGNFAAAILDYQMALHSDAQRRPRAERRAQSAERSVSRNAHGAERRAQSAERNAQQTSNSNQ
eukprot:gene26100-37949_t